MHHILYVDDETGLLEIGKLFLERTGHFSVDTVDSAPEALRVIAEKRYDAIISDYQMPEMDGIELLKRVRTSCNTIPFIIFTGRGREEIVIQALNEGADFYLQKGGEPVSQFTELAHTVQKAISQKQAERSIRDYERREADIINFLPDATFAIDKSGHVITWNHAIEEMTGVPATEMLGKGDYEYAIPFYGQRRPILIDLISESDEVIAKKYSHIIHEKDVLIAETTLPHPKGKSVILMGKASPLYNRRGEIVGAIESIRDITEMREAEESLRESEGQFSAFMDHLPVTAFIKDTHSTNLFVNRRMEEIFGPGEWIGRTVREQFPEETAEKMIEDDRQTLKDGYRKTIENLTVKNGDLRNFETYKFRIDRENKTPLIGGFAVDITERKQVESALHESEEKYRLVVENSHDAISIFHDNQLLFVNSRASDLTGFTKEELLNMNLWDLIHPDDRLRLQELTTRRLAGEEIPPAPSARILTKSGEVREGDLFVDRVIYLGQPAVLGIFRDITEQKRADRAIRESEQKYRTVFETTGTATVLVENDATISLANSEFERLSGYGKEEIENKKKWTEFVVKEDLDRMLAQHQLRRLNRQSALTHYEFRFISRSGDIRDIYLTIDVIPDTKKSVASLLDITERKKAESELRAAYEQLTATEGELRRQFRELAENEQKLRQSEERYRSLVETTGTGYVILDKDGRVITANQEYIRLTGRSTLAEIEGRAVTDWTAPYDIGRNANEVMQCFRNGHVRGLEIDYQKPDGTIQPIEINASVIQSDSGKIILTLCRDIHGRRQVEDELQESDFLFREVFDNANDGVFLVERGRDGPGKYRLVNNKAVLMLGYSKEELLEMSPIDVVPEDVAKKIIPEAMKKLVTEGHATFESENRRKDGSIFPIEVSIRSFRYKGKDIDLSIIRDITERKRDVEALQQASKKLNLLSGVTRHDIKNQLLTLDSFVTLLQKKIPDPSHDNYFSRIMKASNQIANLIQFTREYEKIGVQAPLWQDIPTLVNDAVKAAVLGQVTLFNDLPAGREVFADPLIAKVFFNLVDNAIRHGGKITSIRFSFEERNGDRIIVCEDNGDGITRQEKERIFELGYGKNTGFGLAISREILDITGITIRETGNAGKGARFEITIPKEVYRVACGK